MILHQEGKNGKLLPWPQSITEVRPQIALEIFLYCLVPGPEVIFQCSHLAP